MLGRLIRQLYVSLAVAIGVKQSESRRENSRLLSKTENELRTSVASMRNTTLLGASLYVCNPCFHFIYFALDRAMFCNIERHTKGVFNCDL